MVPQNDTLPKCDNSIFDAGFTPRIVNISSYELNTSEISILMKGRKFCPTPSYKDLLSLSVNMGEFSRKLLLKEMYGGHGNGGNADNPERDLVKRAGTFIPQSDSNSFLHSVVGEIKKLSKNLYKLPVGRVNSNIKPQERMAMNRLSKNKQLVIKSADKGGGIVVMDATYYQNKVEEHLNDHNTYEELANHKNSTVMSKIEKFAKKYETEHSILTKDESLYLRKFDCKTPNFFGVPKIHKSSKINAAMFKGYSHQIKIPYEIVDLPFRFINGEVASPTCKLSELLDILLKPFLPLTPSYIRDYTDFLNKLPVLPPEEVEDTIMVTCDVTNMYPNIELDLGLEAIQFWLDKFPTLLHQRFTKDFVLEGLTLVLTNSCFQFNDKHYRLKTGTATGTKVAPSYANLVMAFLETKLYTSVLHTFGYEIHNYIVRNWLRFLDDGFIFWKKSFGEVEVFVDLLNNLDSRLKFTHEKSEEKISFLNVLIYKDANKIQTDVFYKKTDNHDYLPFNSCHPRHSKDNIPYILARIVCTIVSDPLVKRKRLNELSGWLQNSNYPPDKIWESFHLVNQIDQKVLRQKVTKEKNEQLIFVHTNNPNNPLVFREIMKYLNCLKIEGNEKFFNIFKNVDFIQSRKQPSNLGDILQHSYFGNLKFQHGVKKCGTLDCGTCIYLEEGEEAYFPNVDVTIRIKHRFTCDSGYLLYKLRCKGCNEYYIGRTTCLRERLSNHKLKTYNANYRLQKMYIHIFDCAKKHKVTEEPFTIMPFLKLHYDKISEMDIVEKHYIDWLKPGLNTLI